MSMIKIALAAGAIAAALSATASAQTYEGRGYDGRGYDRYAQRDQRSDWRRADTECWNPRANHYEQVRPEEEQNDLDFRRCRMVGERDMRRRDYREECWNPRARHFEEVRRGESQDDLDFGRCRATR
jgi:hypothetical protein